MYDFKHTTDVLIKAWENDHLINESCTACAVGNIVAESCSYEYERELFYTHKCQQLKYRDNLGHWFSLVLDHGSLDKKRGLEQIKQTGYTLDEIKLIEAAFEGRSRYGFTNRDEKNNQSTACGLKNVINVLARIHKVSEIERLQALGRI